MLDGIDPDGMETLNNIAGYALGTAIVAAVIAATIGVYLWLGGKLGKFSGHSSAKGLNAMWLACLGVTFIASASGAITWGVSTSGTEELMPEAAQPQDITVEREAPVSTCDLNTGVRNFEEEDDPLSEEERLDIFSTVTEDAEATGGAAVEQTPEEVRDMIESNDNSSLISLTWTPIGPENCDGTNTSVADGTTVTAEVGPGEGDELDVVAGDIAPDQEGQVSEMEFEVPASEED